MDYYGEKGGVFTGDGRQVGAFVKWKLSRLSEVIGEGGGLRREAYKGWEGEARRYRFVKPVSGEMIFKFLGKGSWYEVKGRVIGDPGTEGENLKMAGTDKPVSRKPGGK